MSFAYSDILNAAMSLPAGERAELVDSLIASLLDAGNSLLDASWNAEIDRRSAEVDAGSADLVPWSKVRRDVTGNA